MHGIDLKPELEEMISQISMKNNYSGNKISKSIMDQFEIEITELHDGILAPYWLSVIERGRGPRKSTQDHGLWQKIYSWMARRNMFKSGTEEGKISEAKSVTWYLNKYGNKQFRSKTFVDIYTTVRKQTIEKIDKKFGQHIDKITMEVI